MSYGLRVFSGSGYIQIDGSYSNYRLVQSGTAVTGNTISYSKAMGRVMVFVRPPVGKPIFAKMVSTASGFGAGAPYAQAPFVYEYRVFERCVDTPTYPSSSYGLRVKDAAGLTTFDSDQVYPRIASTTTFSMPRWFLPGIVIPSINEVPWVSLESLYPALLDGEATPNNGMFAGPVARINADNSVTVSLAATVTGPPTGFMDQWCFSRNILLARA